MYKELKVWQKAMDLVPEIYKICDTSMLLSIFAA